MKQRFVYYLFTKITQFRVMKLFMFSSELPLLHVTKLILIRPKAKQKLFEHKTTIRKKFIHRKRSFFKLILKNYPKMGCMCKKGIDFCSQKNGQMDTNAKKDKKAYCVLMYFSTFLHKLFRNDFNVNN